MKDFLHGFDSDISKSLEPIIIAIEIYIESRGSEVQRIRGVKRIEMSRRSKRCRGSTPQLFTGEDVMVNWYSV